MRIVHLSDIHVWRYTWDPRRLLSKRILGMTELRGGRAARFRLERLDAVVRHVQSLRPDHILITGDLTTTALPEEFEAARVGLAPLLEDPRRVTIVPGNHDRYTRSSVRARAFEAAFGDHAPEGPYPWLRWLDGMTAILGLDPTRAHITAQGLLPSDQLARAQGLTADAEQRPGRLIVACHYPLEAPPAYRRKLAPKRLRNAAAVAAWLATVGPHLYCCGHIHAAWAFTPPGLPGQLCLNAGAPLLRDPTGRKPPGFLEIVLDGPGVTVNHHGWGGSDWMTVPLVNEAWFFAPEDAERTTGRIPGAQAVNRTGEDGLRSE